MGDDDDFDGEDDALEMLKVLAAEVDQPPTTSIGAPGGGGGDVPVVSGGSVVGTAHFNPETGVHEFVDPDPVIVEESSGSSPPVFGPGTDITSGGGTGGGGGGSASPGGGPAPQPQPTDDAEDPFGGSGQGMGLEQVPQFTDGQRTTVVLGCPGGRANMIRLPLAEVLQPTNTGDRTLFIGAFDANGVRTTIVGLRPGESLPSVSGPAGTAFLAVACSRLGDSGSTASLTFTNG